MIGYIDYLRQMGSATYDHRCLQNHFLARWENGKVQTFELPLLTKNFYSWISEFPNSVALIMRNTKNSAAKVELLKVIDDELGNGDPLKVHGFIFDKMMAELGYKIGIPLQQTDLGDVPLLDTTNRLIQGQRHLLGNDNQYIALGAMMAVEWQAYGMQGKLYEGFRNYKSLWKRQDQFHEVASFFYIHLGSAEKEHEEESVKAAAASVRNKEDLDGVVLGFTEHLNLLGDFWQGLEESNNEALLK